MNNNMIITGQSGLSLTSGMNLTQSAPSAALVPMVVEQTANGERFLRYLFKNVKRSNCILEWSSRR